MKPLTPTMKSVLRLMGRMQDPLNFGLNAGQLRMIYQGLYNRGLVDENRKLTQDGRNEVKRLRNEN